MNTLSVEHSSKWDYHVARRVADHVNNKLALSLHSQDPEDYMSWEWDEQEVDEDIHNHLIAEQEREMEEEPEVLIEHEADEDEVVRELPDIEFIEVEYV